MYPTLHYRQVHSILEGMAVGSEKDWLMVFTLTGALSLHKALLAFALGLYCIVLYCIVLYCIVLYCIVFT